MGGTGTPLRQCCCGGGRRCDHAFWKYHDRNFIVVEDFAGDPLDEAPRTSAGCVTASLGSAGTEVPITLTRVFTLCDNPDGSEAEMWRERHPLWPIILCRRLPYGTTVTINSERPGKKSTAR